MGRLVALLLRNQERLTTGSPRTHPPTRLASSDRNAGPRKGSERVLNESKGTEVNGGRGGAYWNGRQGPGWGSQACQRFLSWLLVCWLASVPALLGLFPLL